MISLINDCLLNTDHKTNIMRIGLVQLDIEWESKNSNYARAESFVKKASEAGCDIVVFPEMFNTGFSMNVAAIAEDEDGQAASVLSTLSKKYGINIIGGFPAKSGVDEKGKNLAVVYSREGNLIAKYAKIHPFSYSAENESYIAGNETVVFNIEGLSCSIFICYDLRFPEIFRQVARRVDTIFVIANWPASRKEHWETLLKARAIENQCYIVGVNRTGTDGNGLEYPGGSHIFGPLGDDICSGGEAEELIVGEIDPGEVKEVRSIFPFLKDMR